VLLLRLLLLLDLLLLLLLLSRRRELLFSSLSRYRVFLYSLSLLAPAVHSPFGWDGRASLGTFAFFAFLAAAARTLAGARVLQSLHFSLQAKFSAKSHSLHSQ